MNLANKITLSRVVLSIVIMIVLLFPFEQFGLELPTYVINGSIVIISHQERILNIADEIIVIANGSVSKMGTKEEILPELLYKSNCKCVKGGQNG